MTLLNAKKVLKKKSTLYNTTKIFAYKNFIFVFEGPWTEEEDKKLI